MYKVWLINRRRYLGACDTFGEAMAMGWRERDDFSIQKHDRTFGHYRTIGWCLKPDYTFRALDGSAMEPLAQAVGS